MLSHTLFSMLILFTKRQFLWLLLCKWHSPLLARRFHIVADDEDNNIIVNSQSLASRNISELISSIPCHGQ